MRTVKIMPEAQFALDVLSWQEVRDEVKKNNPHLTKNIDELNPGNKLKLIKLRYLYGSSIVNQGVLQVPTRQNGCIPLTDPKVPDSIRNMLNYSSIPLGLLLNKGSEVFVETKDRIIPLNVLYPGQLFGLFETLSAISKIVEATPIWSVFAGARSAFMFPKITDTFSHRRLKLALNLSCDAPNNPLEHCAIFTEINKKQPLDNQWYSEILIFTTDWFIADHQNQAWKEYQNYLLKAGWAQTTFRLEDTLRHMLWESLASAMTQRRLKPRAYLVDTVKHLISIGMGGTPGFRSAEVGEILLPNLCVEEAYINHYQLKDYVPLLIQPHILRGNQKYIPAYYFMAFPTLFAGAPSQRGTPSILMDIRDIKTIIETLGRKLHNEGHMALNHIKDILYSYYHRETDPFGEISDSRQMPLTDLGLMDIKKYQDRIFPSNAPFIPGCIKIEIRSKTLGAEIDGQSNTPPSWRDDMQNTSQYKTTST